MGYRYIGSKARIANEIIEYIGRPNDSDGYFIVGETSHPDVIFACEAAIDAISLMMLYAGGEPGCAYASIGGAGCTAAIQRKNTLKWWIMRGR